MSTEKKQLSATPWEAKDLYGNWVIVSADNNAINIHHNEANAKLIAAAPEMLCLLEDIVWRGALDTNYTNRVKDIIKKATE